MLKPHKVGIRPDVAMSLYYNAGFAQHARALAEARKIVANDPLLATRLAKVERGTLPFEEGMMMWEAYALNQMTLEKHVSLIVNELKRFDELDSLNEDDMGVVPEVDGEENSNTQNEEK